MEISCIPPAPTHAQLPPVTNISQQSGIFVKIDEPTLTHHFLPSSFFHSLIFINSLLNAKHSLHVTQIFLFALFLLLLFLLLFLSFLHLSVFPSLFLFIKKENNFPQAQHLDIMIFAFWYIFNCKYF